MDWRRVAWGWAGALLAAAGVLALLRGLGIDTGNAWWFLLAAAALPPGALLLWWVARPPRRKTADELAEALEPVLPAGARVGVRLWRWWRNRKA